MRPCRLKRGFIIPGEVEEVRVGSGLVHDLRDHRAPASEEDLADLETDVLAGFVLARASAGLADSTIRNDTGHLQLIRD
jgi:hypothetical protein